MAMSRAEKRKQPGKSACILPRLFLILHRAKARDREGAERNRGCARRHCCGAKARDREGAKRNRGCARNLMKKHMKNPLYLFLFVQWIFRLFYPLDLPPYLIDIYLKLFFQIVFSLCESISHWTIPLFFYIFGFKIKFLVVRPPFLLMYL